MFLFYSIRNHNAINSKIRTKKNLGRKILRKILQDFYCRDLEMSCLEYFWKFDKRGGIGGDLRVEQKRLIM